MSLHCKGRLYSWEQPLIMGILNVTPDSFYAESRLTQEKAVLEKSAQMLEEGADILDIGGYSSRPGAAEVSEAEELARVIPPIRQVTQRFPDALISVDTFRSRVAQAALEAGAHIVNDISGGAQDPAIYDVVAQAQAPYILMHMRGTPQTMSQQTDYQDLPAEVYQYFQQRTEQLKARGVKDIILDPGLGFAKTKEQNWQLLHQIEYFLELGYPLLIGLSRKSMIWKTLGIRPEEALNGTTTAHTIALLQGAQLLRVHDVKEAVEAKQLVAAFKQNAG